MGRLRHQLGFWAFIFVVAANVGILLGAMFGFTSGAGEPPCPFCIAQRMGMMLSSLGAMFIAVHALRGQLSHKNFTTGLGMALLGAMLGGAVSFRQLPLHLAGWAIIDFLVVIALCGVFLLFAHEFQPAAPRSRWARRLAWIVIWLFIAIIALNMVVVFAAEGFNWYLPGDPITDQPLG